MKLALTIALTLTLTLTLFMTLLGNPVLSESKQEQYKKYQERMNKLLNEKQDSSKTEANNEHMSKNVIATFTSCKGLTIAPSVLIMPREYPEKHKSKYVIFKFIIDVNSTPQNIEITEGNEDLANLSIRSLQRSKIESKYAKCWLAKYEFYG